MSDCVIKSVSVKNGECEFTMEYAQFGNGPRTMVIVPGLSIKYSLASAKTVAESFKSYCDEYTIYLFDRIKDAKLGYTIAHMARDLAYALKAINISNADFYATSQGGMVTQYLAIEHPELTHKIVLASSSSRAEPEQNETIGHWAHLAEAGDGAALVNDFIEKAFTPKFLERYRRALLMLYRHVSPEELSRFAIMARACETVNSYDDLGKIKCPVFVIAADMDQVVTYRASVKMVEKFKATGVPCKFYTYEGCGHAVYDEAKDYKDRMLEFFKK